MSWTLIESQTLSSSQASVTLGSGGSLPQTYKTLMLVHSLRTTGTGGQAILLRPNADTTGAWRMLEGSGAAAASYSSSANINIGETNGTGQTANTFTNGMAIIPNYTSSANKPIAVDAVTENNAATAYQDLTANLWSSASAITSLVVTTAADQFVSGSTFTLYGLRA